MLVHVVNRCYNNMKKIRPVTRAKARISAFFVMFLLALLYGSYILSGVHLLYKCIFGAVLMGIVIAFSISPDLQRKWTINVPMAMLWLGLGVIQLISGFAVSLEYLPMACIWLVCFSALFYIRGLRGDLDRMFHEAATGGNFCFLIVIAGSALVFPVRSEPYGGMLINPNGLGQWVVFAFPVIYFLYLKSENKMHRILYLSEIGMIYLFTVLSQSRTTLLSVLAMSIFAIALQIQRNRRNFKKLLKKTCIFVLCVTLACSAFLVVNRAAYGIGSACGASYDFIDQLLFNGNPPGEQNDKEKLDQNDEEKPDQNDEEKPDKNDTEKIGIIEHILAFLDRVQGKDKIVLNINDYSSGRTGIWLAVLNKTNLLGHPSRDHIITPRNGDVGSNAHNTALQFLYENGILAFFLYLAMVIYSLFRVMKALIRSHTPDSLHIAVLLAQIGYLITGMFASLNLPFLYVQAFLYYLTYGVVMDSKFVPSTPK